MHNLWIVNYFATACYLGLIPILRGAAHNTANSSSHGSAGMLGGSSSPR